ncbi:MAG: xylulokinase [Nibricoccus sp.]
MSLFIGIDCGTQGTKGIILDRETGETLATARASHSLISGLPAGHSEQNPSDWTEALEKVLDGLLDQVDRAEVRGIGISGQQHGFVPLDANGKVIRPAKLWNDTSTAEECAILTKKLGGDKAVLRKTGLRFLPGFTAPKILWLKRHEPKNFKRLAHVLLPHDYLNWYLTGNYVMEYGDASGTALLDVRKRIWSKEAVRAIDPGLEKMLPELIEAHQPAGRVSPAIAERFGLSPDVLVSAGGGDNMMGAIGTGNVEPGIVSASFGTSGTIYACSKTPVVDPAGEIAAFCDSTGNWLPLLCTMNVTTATEMMRGLLGRDLRQYDEDVLKTPPGADGLVLLPYFEGERTPSVPNGTGNLFGLNRRTFTPGHFLRAAMEGATLGMNYGLLRLRALGIKPKEIRVTGGGMKTPVWRQIAADVFGVSVVAMKEDEGAALGGALQAAWCVDRAAGLRTSLRDLTRRYVAVDEATRCKPNKSAVAIYKKLQAVQDDLSVTLRPVFERR